MNQELEYNVGEDENSATVELNEDGSEAVLQDQEQAPAVAVEGSPQEGGELEDYSEKVKKRIDKLTARLRETQRREEAAITYARSVQQRAQQLEQQFQRTDAERLIQTRSRIDTEASTLRQIIRKAREEGDFDTETEAQERLTNIMYDQRRIADAEASRQQQLAAQQTQQTAYQQQAAQAPRTPQPDPKAEDWAERNDWFGRDVAMTAAARGIHIQLVQAERFDPTSDEYYDELDRRIRESFPQKFSGGNQANTTQNNRANRPVQTVAPATRSSGVNNSARRTVRLTPSQVAIAKKLNVPLEEYAKYVKE
jgi:hypothetical protein